MKNEAYDELIEWIENHIDLTEEALARTDAEHIRRRIPNMEGKITPFNRARAEGQLSALKMVLEKVVFGP